MASRYKGLTTDQQDRLLFAFREDTLIQGGAGYPARQSEIGAPSDGSNSEYWKSATNDQLFLGEGGDTIAYQSSDPSGLVFSRSASDEFYVPSAPPDNLDNINAQYAGQLHHETLTLTCRVGAASVSSGENHAFVATGMRSDSTVFWFGYEADGSGDVIVRALLKDGGTTIYDSQGSSTTVTLNASGHDRVSVEQNTSTGTVSVKFNGTETFSASSVNFPSGPVTPTKAMMVGGAQEFGTDNVDHLDGVLQGFAVDTQTGVGSSLGAWVEGNNYTPSTTSGGTTSIPDNAGLEHDPTSIIALHIEGIGTEGDVSGGYQPDGILWATSGVTNHNELLGELTNFTYYDALQLDSLGGTDTLVEPFRSSARWSSYGFELDAAENELAERLLFEQRRADGALTERLTSTDTSSVTTDVTDGSLADKIVYIGDETLELGAHFESGEYAINSRGVYKSRQLNHPNGQNIFTSTPYWNDRRATLYTIEHSGGPDLTDAGNAAANLTLEERWRGRINGDLVQDHGRIAIDCFEMMAGLDQVTGGHEDRTPTNIRAGNYVEVNDDIRAKLYASGEPRVVKPDATLTSNDNGVTTAMDVDGEVIPLALSIDTSSTPSTYQTDSWRAFYPPRFGRSFDASKVDDNPGEGDNVIRERDVHEIMAADRLAGDLAISAVAKVGEQLGDVGAFDRDNTYTWHPLTYFAAICFSTPENTVDASNFDVLQGDWSLDLRWLFDDGIIQDVKDLIDATPNYRIDRLALGMGGEAVELWRRARELFLYPWGFYVGIDNNGQATLNRISTFDIEDFDTAKGNTIQPSTTEVLSYSTGRGSATDTIEVTVGGMGPAQGETIQVRAQDNTKNRSGKLNRKPDLRLDLSTVAPENKKEVIDRAVSRALIQAYAIPRLRIQVDDHLDDSKKYGLGEPVALDSLNLEPEWIIDKAGNRVQDPSQTQQEFAGIIIGRKFKTAEDGASIAYELECLLHSDVLTRWRAPSGVVKGVPSRGGGQTKLTLEGDGGADSAFGDTVTDVSRFSVGDEVRIINQDGTQWSADNEFAKISNIDTGDHTIVVDIDFGEDPPIDSIVELAPLDSDESGPGGADGYWNPNGDSTVDLSNIDILYTFMADDSSTLGSADLSAHQYGG